jgi:hypothetical protein
VKRVCRYCDGDETRVMDSLAIATEGYGPLVQMRVVVVTTGTVDSLVG